MENTKTITREDMRAEGVERMTLLNLHPQAVREFAKGEKVNFSLSGILYWLDEKMTEEVKAFEKKYNCMVYHVIHSTTEIGELLTLLYVSSNDEDWEDDRADLKEAVEDYKGIKFYNPYAYVINRSNPDFSEFGRVGIKPMFGGVIRIY